MVEEALRLPRVAVMVTVPLGVAVLSTVTKPAVVTVACVVSLELQATDVEILLLLWSEARSCSVLPGVTVAVAGVTFTEVAVLTSSVAVAVASLDFAVIVVVPMATPVARPACVMVAMPVDEELQFTCPVTSCVVLLPRVPVAVNCVVAAGATSPLVGEIVIETMAFDDGKKSPQLVDMETTNSTQTSAAKTDLFSDLMRRTSSSLM